MNRLPARPFLIAAAAGLLAVFAAACGSDEEAPAGAEKMRFELTDQGCEPQDARAAAGPISFEIENAGTTKVTEMEIMDGETILAEKENLSEGLSGSFSLSLEAGEYTIYCPGGEDERGTLTVSGELRTKSNPQVEGAISSYRSYLERNSAELVAATKPFVAAVVAGNLAEAKARYAAARIPYERIEPVAESFSEFEGFHRIEKALWEEGTAKGMAPVAEQLQADVEELAERVETMNLQAVQIANGANELLGEVSASKISGEEERYSHTDLVDFKANLEGAEAAFEAIEPMLKSADPELEDEIEEGFEAVYAELTEADTRKLTRSIDVLAEKLSQVPAQIVG